MAVVRMASSYHGMDIACATACCVCVPLQPEAVLWLAGRARRVSLFAEVVAGDLLERVAVRVVALLWMPWRG